MNLLDPNLRAPEVCIRSQTPFGIGGRRLCFVDPRDASRCIKILRRDDGQTIRIPSIIPKWLRRKYDNNAHEQKELSKLFKRIGGEASECLPRCYGVVQTDLGPGLVLDLIRDPCGKISRSLRQLVSIGYRPDEFRDAFEIFSQFMLRHLVLTRAILDHNLVAQKLGKKRWHLFLIDGLGDPAWISFARFSKRIAHSKIQKRLKHFWPKLEHLSKNPVTPNLLTKSSWGQGFLNRPL